MFRCPLSWDTTFLSTFYLLFTTKMSLLDVKEVHHVFGSSSLWLLLSRTINIILFPKGKGLLRCGRLRYRLDDSVISIRKFNRTHFILQVVLLSLPKTIYHKTHGPWTDSRNVYIVKIRSAITMGIILRETGLPLWLRFSKLRTS